VDDTGLAASCIMFDAVDNFITFGWQAAGTSPFTSWQVMAVVSAAAASANYLQLIAQATGATPQLTAQGADPNIGINVVTKGTGVLSVNGQAVGAGNEGVPGYVRLGPVTLQWGVVAISVTAANTWTSATVTFPVAFSAGVSAVSLTIYGQASTSQQTSWANAANGTFTASVIAGATGTYTVTWFAVGPT
jgi:hypothetical protein